MVNIARMFWFGLYLLASSTLLRVVKAGDDDRTTLCEYTAVDDEHIWTPVDENSTLQVISIKIPCDTIPENETKIDPRVTTLAIQEGTVVNLSCSCPGTTLHKVTTDIFLSPDQLDVTSDVNDILDDNSTVRQDSPLTFTPGTHTLLCLSLDKDNNYTVTCKLNIIIKTNGCHGNNEGDPCGDHGHCTATNNETQFTCKCCHGYGGQNCQELCPKHTCRNGGTCFFPGNDMNDTNNDINWKCVCPPHVTGSNCDVILNHCKSSPCVHGLCLERVNGFQCYCIPGFHGGRCELEYNECLSNPCSENGRCVDKIDQFECRCNSGYTGVTCETKVDICNPNPCHGNASCTDLGDHFHCACPDDMCKRLHPPHSHPCHSNPCHNHGSCEVKGEGYRCHCGISFGGTHCEYMIDVFAPPMESSDISAEVHTHNLYIVAATLGTMVLVVVSVTVACYCKIYETYKQLMWRKLRYHRKRSNSCPDFDTVSTSGYHHKQRLSVDGLLEATSLFHENTAYESQSTSLSNVVHSANEEV